MKYFWLVLMATFYVYGLPADSSYVVLKNGQELLRTTPTIQGGVVYTDVDWRGHLYEVVPAADFNIPPCVDLIISAVQVQPADPTCQTTNLRIVAQVKNQGTSNAGPSSVGYLIDGSVVGEVATPGLNAGESRWITYYVSQWPNPGVHQASACADSQGQVEESNEENNCAE